MLQELNILLYRFHNPSWATRNIFKISFCGGIKLATSQRYAYLSFSIVRNCGWLWHDKNHSKMIPHFFERHCKNEEYDYAECSVGLCNFFECSSIMWPISNPPWKLFTFWNSNVHAAILFPPTLRSPIFKVTLNFILNGLTKYKVFCMWS